jgi:hypothetical protein
VITLPLLKLFRTDEPRYPQGTGVWEWNWLIPGNSGIEIIPGIEKSLYLSILLFLFPNSLTQTNPHPCAKEIPFPLGGRETET